MNCTLLWPFLYLTDFAYIFHTTYYKRYITLNMFNLLTEPGCQKFSGYRHTDQATDRPNDKPTPRSSELELERWIHSKLDIIEISIG